MKVKKIKVGVLIQKDKVIKPKIAKDEDMAGLLAEVARLKRKHIVNNS